MPASASRIHHSLDDVRALVVEDDADVREGMAELLRSEGAQVFTERSGNDGFACFTREHPDVLVSDLWMPDGNGYDLIARVRQLSPADGGLTPAIAVSAAENMRTALMAGFHVFLAKPFDWFELIHVVGDFAKPDGGQAVAPWTMLTTRPGQLLITFVGRVETGDMRAMTKVLNAHLENGPVEITSDLRQLTSFSPSVASVAERAVWSLRHRITAVRVVGGSTAARLVSAAACKMLGIPCSFASSIERETPDQQ